MTLFHEPIVTPDILHIYTQRPSHHLISKWIPKATRLVIMYTQIPMFLIYTSTLTLFHINLTSMHRTTHVTRLVIIYTHKYPCFSYVHELWHCCMNPASTHRTTPWLNLTFPRLHGNLFQMGLATPIDIYLPGSTPTIMRIAGSIQVQVWFLRWCHLLWWFSVFNYVW